MTRLDHWPSRLQPLRPRQDSVAVVLGMLPLPTISRRLRVHLRRLCLLHSPQPLHARRTTTTSVHSLPLPVCRLLLCCIPRLWLAHPPPQLVTMMTLAPSQAAPTLALRRLLLRPLPSLPPLRLRRPLQLLRLQRSTPLRRHWRQRWRMCSVTSTSEMPVLRMLGHRQQQLLLPAARQLNSHLVSPSPHQQPQQCNHHHCRLLLLPFCPLAMSLTMTLAHLRSSLLSLLPLLLLYQQHRRLLQQPACCLQPLLPLLPPATTTSTMHLQHRLCCHLPHRVLLDPRLLTVPVTRTTVSLRLRRPVHRLLCMRLLLQLLQARWPRLACMPLKPVMTRLRPRWRCHHPLQHTTTTTVLAPLRVSQLRWHQLSCSLGALAVCQQ